MAGINGFCKLFTSDALEIYKLLRHTYQFIKTDGWTIGRLHWLTEKNLLKNKNMNGKYSYMTLRILWRKLFLSLFN